VLLRRKAEGHLLGWLILTGIAESAGASADRVHARDAEIARVAEMVGFDWVENLRLPTATLDDIPTADIVAQVSRAFQDFQPNEVFLPHHGDAHSDHHVAFDGVAACTKWFRYPSVQRGLAYETLSETDFGLIPGVGFTPTIFVDISAHLPRKLEIMNVYASEMGTAPFLRSVEALRALATLRGEASGYAVAEAFQLLRERL
jgi:LmbE family N-acetylglucosaminyl deacetylase